MRPKYFFESNKISYAEFLKTIEVMLENKVLFCDKMCVEFGVDALGRLNEKAQDKLINASFEIDRKFSVSGAHNRNCAHKLPIILKCADLLANCGKRIDNLTEEQLILVSHYYSASPTPYEHKRFDFFLDKNVLKNIQNKSSNYDTQFDMMFAIDLKLEELGIENMNDEQYKTTKVEMLNKINNSSREDVLNMVNVQERITEAMRRANI